MLQACCDCFNGTDDNGDKNVEYKPILNNYKAPPWPTQRDTFLLPTKLGPEDKISFLAIMSEGAQNFKISLVSGNENPDYRNICNQLVVKMPSVYDKKNYVYSLIVINGIEEIVHGGNHDIQATDYFSDAHIKIKYILVKQDNRVILSTYIGENNFFGNVELRHKMEDLRFLTYDGDIDRVKKLNFLFAVK